ncbi:MAG: hypothetical protein JW857_02645 [Bacteroidales bacterium]|nr:hypothetical protein [Bacteroidales bacterium]
MKTALILIVLFISTQVFAQEKYLSITNLNNGKETRIKENSRIKLKTLDGEKLKGKFQISDDNHIRLASQTIPLNHIDKIKRNPLVMTIAVDGILLVGAGASAYVGLALAIFGGSGTLLYTLPFVGGFIYGAAKSPNILPAYQRKNNLQIEIKP